MTSPLRLAIIEVLQAQDYIKWLSYNPDDDDEDLTNAKFKLNDKIHDLTRLMNNNQQIAIDVAQKIYKYDSIVGLPHFTTT